MKNLNILKKKIIYRSKHRGTKEMDLLLSKFVEKYINIFSKNELFELESLLSIEDEIIYKWYLNSLSTSQIPENSVSKKLKEFKL